MEFYKLINKELERKYGKDLSGRPYYRIVQNSKNLVEKRQGSRDHYAGRIYVGSEEGVFELPKYSYIPEDLWILEALMFVNNPELLTPISYEPKWVFREEDWTYQQPTLQSCIFLVESIRRGPAPQETKEEKAAKQYKKDMELISGGEAAGCISDRISWGEGVSYSGLDAPVLIKDTN